MSKKRNDKESMICLTPKPTYSFFYRKQSKQKDFTEKDFFKKKGGVDNWTKNEKKVF